MSKVTALEEFRESLRATGSYETNPSHKPPKRTKPGALTTLRFSLGVARVFPMCALLQPIGRLTTDKWAHLCFSSVQIAEKLGMTVRLDGWKNREKYDGPVMYLCNHMSTFETILLPPVLLTYGPFNVVAKASLNHLPFLEKAAKEMGLVPIGRKSPREDLVNILRIGTERIKAGNSFLIFPQGSREKVFSRKMYSSIGAKLAEKAGCPVVPIAVDTRCQPCRPSGMFKDFGPVDTSLDIRCECGPVIPCTKAKAMHEEVFDWIAGRLDSWGLPVER